MAVVEPHHTLEFLLSEGNGQISRETITVAEGQKLEAGTVLGKITASGFYTQLDPAAADGSEAAAAILIAACDATDADTKAAVIARDAEVSDARLTWPVGISQPEKASAVAELAAMNIHVR